MEESVCAAEALAGAYKKDLSTLQHSFYKKVCRQNKTKNFLLCELPGVVSVRI